MISIKYATGNVAKIESCKMILKDYDIDVEQVILDDLYEIQADTNEEAAIFSSRLAHEKIGGIVLKNDGGLFIPKLKGFPGVYSSFVENTITEKGILDLLKDYENDEDRYAYFIECLALTFPDGETKVFTCKTEGVIAKEASGTFGWGYDKIFIPKGEIETLANFEDEKRYSFWAKDGYIEMCKYLKEKYKE